MENTNYNFNYSFNNITINSFNNFDLKKIEEVKNEIEVEKKEEVLEEYFDDLIVKYATLYKTNKCTYFKFFDKIIKFNKVEVSKKNKEDYEEGLKENKNNFKIVVFKNKLNDAINLKTKLINFNDIKDDNVIVVAISTKNECFLMSKNKNVEHFFSEDIAKIDTVNNAFIKKNIVNFLHLIEKNEFNKNDLDD